MPKERTDFFNRNYQEYDAWYDAHPAEYEDQIKFISALLPEGNGIEIGVGTGRFASRLGIRTGIDLSEKMVGLAIQRGIDASTGDATSLPFGDKEFDFSLNMVTICFLDDPISALKEAGRVSRETITVILDRESEYVQEISKKGEGFYAFANFYSAGELVDMYIKAGFKEITVREEDLMTSDGKAYRLVGVTGK